MHDLTASRVLVGASQFIIGLVFVLACISYFPHTVDDAYIVARYAENLVENRALIFNPGETINALTSPLHALIEAFLYLLTRNTITGFKIVGFLALVGTLILCIHVFRHSPLFMTISASGILISPYIVLWTFGGLETPLLLLLVTALGILVLGTSAYSGKRLSLIAILAGLALLVRYDSILFTVPVFLYAALQARSPKNVMWASIAGAALPLAWILVSYLYYGDILPTSYYVKKPTFNWVLARDNARYIIQYLIYGGVVPLGAIAAAMAVFTPGQIAGSSNLGIQTRPQFSSRARLWQILPIGVGILSMLVYGLSVATTHMMFSFRYFVPYLPITLIALCFWIKRHFVSQSVQSARAHWMLYVFLVLFIPAQIVQLITVYRHSLNPVIFGVGEFQRVGVREAISVMQVPLGVAEEIQNHWQVHATHADRPPRIATYAAGILPYYYRQAYIYEMLVSYRHHCEYNWRLSADYINILVPLHGPVDSQLPMPVDHYSLLLTRPFTFEETRQEYMVFYNPDPEPNRLPPRVDGDCK